MEQGRDTKYASDYLSALGFEQSRKLPAKTILVTCIGATIGKTGIISAAGSCNQQINAIIPNHGAFKGGKTKCVKIGNGGNGVNGCVIEG